MSHEDEGILSICPDHTDGSMLAVCRSSVGGTPPEPRLADRTGDSELAVCLSTGVGSQESERQSMDLCRASHPGGAVLASLHAHRDLPGPPVAAVRNPYGDHAFLDTFYGAGHCGLAP